jgi:DNA-binding protein H-NS
MPLSLAASRLSGHPFGRQSNPRVWALLPDVEVRGTFKATKAAVRVKAEVAPKYLHQKTGVTGRGRAPAWIAEAKDRSRFLISSAADATVATTAGAASKAKNAVKTASKTVGATPGKGQRKGPQPALYRDAKSGATWSGRGPAPAWLSGAKDRAKFLIVGAVEGAAEPKTAAAKGAVPAKKATAKKVVAKKSVRTKAATKKAAVKKPRPAPAKTASKKVGAKRGRQIR